MNEENDDVYDGDCDDEYDGVCDDVYDDGDRDDVYDDGVYDVNDVDYHLIKDSYQVLHEYQNNHYHDNLAEYFHQLNPFYCLNLS
jgi:hypothetical protein